MIQTSKIRPEGDACSVRGDAARVGEPRASVFVEVSVIARVVLATVCNSFE